MAERVTRRVVKDDTIIRVEGTELGDLIQQLGAIKEDEELVDIFVQVPGSGGVKAYNLSLLGDVDLLVSVKRVHEGEFTKETVPLSVEDEDE